MGVCDGNAVLEGSPTKPDTITGSSLVTHASVTNGCKLQMQGGNDVPLDVSARVGFRYGPQRCERNQSIS